MRRLLKVNFEPNSGIYDTFHVGLLILLPLLVFVLVRVQFAGLALALILLSKWRMLAVKPRYWAANIRANSVDIIVGLSALAFVLSSGSILWQLVWLAGYAAWLIALKPRAELISVSAQALIGQMVGLVALFLVWPGAPTYVLVIACGAVCYLAAHHFFNAFDEAYTRLLAYIWGYFGAALSWTLGHWLLFYGPLAQPALILIIIGASLGTIYYLDHRERLSVVVRSELILIMVTAVAVILAFSNWSGKIV